MLIEIIKTTRLYVTEMVWDADAGEARPSQTHVDIRDAAPAEVEGVLAYLPAYYHGLLGHGPAPANAVSHKVAVIKKCREMLKVGLKDAKLISEHLIDFPKVEEIRPAQEPAKVRWDMADDSLARREGWLLVRAGNGPEIRTASFLDGFETREDALAHVRQKADEYGPGSVWGRAARIHDGMAVVEWVVA